MLYDDRLNEPLIVVKSLSVFHSAPLEKFCTP